MAFVSHRLFLTVCKTVRGVNIGVGHGSSRSAAKREASVQALVYLKSHCKYDPRRLILGTLKFSSERRYPDRERSSGARFYFILFLNTVRSGPPKLDASNMHA